MTEYTELTFSTCVNIFGFTNSIDFVTNNLLCVGFSGNISFYYNSIYQLTSSTRT